MTNDVSNWFRYFSNDQNGVLENCLASHTNKNPTAFSPWFFFEWGEERAVRCTKPKIITFVSNAAVDRVFFDAKPSCWRVCCYSCNFMHFFCFALRAHGMRANKSDNANNRQRLQIPTFMCCYAMVCCADVLCNFSNCLTLELQKIQSQTAGRKRERAMHHLQCRDFYFDFMSFLSPYSIVKKSVCILRQTVVENDDGGGHLHFPCSSR